MHLTNHVVPVPRACGTPVLLKALEKAGFAAKWAASPWAKKQAVRAKRANLSDFDRFKVMVAKKQVGAGRGRGRGRDIPRSYLSSNVSLYSFSLPFFFIPPPIHTQTQRRSIVFSEAKKVKKTK